MNRDQIIQHLSNSIVEIVFTKRDGSDRKMVGTLLPIHVQDKIVGAGRTTPEHLVPLIDLERDEWRSFDINSLKSFRVIS